MAVSTIVILVLVVSIQGCVVLCEDSVPEKIEHGEKGKSEYNVNTITLTGSQHTKVDDEDTRPPPWPPRPGRRSTISHVQARNSFPTIMRPGREIATNKRQFILRPGRGIKNGPPFGVLRPGREDVPQHILRPGREHIPGPPSFLRPGREDVPEAPPRLLRPGREDVPGGPPSLLRPGRADVPEGPPSFLRPGREDVSQGTIFRPGREIVRRQSVHIFRPGREVPDQFLGVRPGRRSIRYKMPWTFVGNSIDAHMQRKSHTFHQKAKQEDSGFQ